jgi:serine/threonine-protein kinase
MKEHPNYRILEKLGESVWTEVYRAWDDSPLQRDVAVKMLKDEHVAVDHLRRQFWERVKAMSDLRHERLLPVHSTDTERDWVILELADESVATRVAREAVAVGEVQSWLAQALEGLQALHARRRLHGQIKPANLLLYRSGRLKLTDPGALIDGNLQLVPGGEKYLAPEVADTTGRFGAAEPGPQLDFYVLGFCALEMLAGPGFDPLFPGMTAGGADTASLWWQWHASDADPRGLVGRLVPPSAGRLRTALEMMLAKRVSDRVATAGELLERLGTAAIPDAIRADAASAPPAAPVPARPFEIDARDALLSAIPVGQAQPPRTAARPSADASRPSTTPLQRWAVVGMSAAAALVAAVVLVVVSGQSRRLPADDRPSQPPPPESKAVAAVSSEAGAPSAAVPAKPPVVDPAPQPANPPAPANEPAATKIEVQPPAEKPTPPPPPPPPVPPQESPDDLSDESLR